MNKTMRFRDDLVKQDCKSRAGINLNFRSCRAFRSFGLGGEVKGIHGIRFRLFTTFLEASVLGAGIPSIFNRLPLVALKPAWFSVQTGSGVFALLALMAGHLLCSFSPCLLFRKFRIPSTPEGLRKIFATPSPASLPWTPSYPPDLNSFYPTTFHHLSPLLRLGP